MKSVKSKKARVQSEIGEVVYSTGKVQFDSTNLMGKAIKVEKPAVWFSLKTVGPKGRTFPYKSDPFEANVTQYRSGWQVDFNQAADKALDQLIKMLWEDGWEPTSFGSAWYEIRFRRPSTQPDIETEKPNSSAESNNVHSEAFRKVRDQYSQLRADLAAGKLNPDRYRAALANLKIQDPSGATWMIDGQSGRWMKWDGTNWIKAEPLNSL